MSDSDDNICNICCHDYNQSSRKQHDCPSCGYSTCRSCIRTYLLNKSDDPHCLNCKNRWELDTLIHATGRTWVNKDYRNHKKNVLFEHEKSRLAATMPAVENYKVCLKLEQDGDKLQDQIRELQRQSHLLKAQQSNLMTELYRRRRGGGPKEKRKFMKACPAEDCRGFLSTQWKCALCSTQVCSKCFAIKSVDEEGAIIEHECKENDLKSAETIRKETRSCPSCAAPVFKTEGCDQMWCTQCHTAFSWRTGLKVNGVVHNPHFYAWQNNGGAAPRANVPGAIMCGGLPPLYTFRNTIVQVLQTPYAFRRHTNISLSDDEKLAVCAVDLHRACSHFAHVELDRVRRTCNGALDNEEVRIKYILKELDEEAVKREIIRRDKKRNKALAMLQIYELVNTVFTEGIRDILQCLLNQDGDETPVEIIERNLQRCHALRDYANDELGKISVMYSQSVAFIQETFYTTRKKYKASELK
jgi:hypothetical protein